MDGDIIVGAADSIRGSANPVEHGQSGEQDDGRDPEMNIGEDYGPNTSGLRRRVFIRHKAASVLIEQKGC
jgi:hypothetical protein